ncbi:hypothetical protein FGO68_gene13417 [Halteria grandinella]|uniref:Uncharacterized protein n=1 Tax=Halteria grandinella TaxID=5974 RepID=A0A8J8NAC3_HALGN|nr:hypothetical protein FGO68_gene13417 [Halteria grandinella]
MHSVRKPPGLNRYDYIIVRNLYYILIISNLIDIPKFRPINSKMGNTNPTSCCCDNSQLHEQQTSSSRKESKQCTIHMNFAHPSTVHNSQSRSEHHSKSQHDKARVDTTTRRQSACISSPNNIDRGNADDKDDSIHSQKQPRGKHLSNGFDGCVDSTEISTMSQPQIYHSQFGVANLKAKKHTVIVKKVTGKKVVVTTKKSYAQENNEFGLNPVDIITESSARDSVSQDGDEFQAIRDKSVIQQENCTTERSKELMFPLEKSGQQI